MSIHCSEQNHRLTELNSSDNLWVGGSDSATEGDWVFVDGASVTYANWYPGEPNNYGGNQDCMDFNYQSPGLWNDTGCTSTKKAIYHSPTPITGMTCMSYLCKYYRC